MNQTVTFSSSLRPIKLFVLLIVLFSFTAIQNLKAQNVSVSGALIGNGSYPDLGSAFTAINGGAQTAAIIQVSIVGNTTEGVSAILNQGAWTSLTISPSGGTARTISGSIVGHLVDLNGADNVTIDGLNAGGNSLTISNAALGASSAIRFVNDASNNVVTKCSLQGSGDASFGVVYFGTGTTTGNDGNNVNNCSIGPTGTNLPLNGIFSLGSSAVIDNSGITINANSIFDYFNATSASSGMNINSFNSNWTITNNKLFQTATRLYTVSATHNGISITSGVGYMITGNVIGFANSAGTGTTNIVGNSVALAGFPGSYTPSGTANATRYIAINCAFTAGGAVSSIQNNTIAGFALYTSSGATTTNGILCGINVTAGNVDIGTITGNTIGSTTGTGSIYTACTTTGGAVVGIFASSVNTVNINNNTVGAIDAMGTTATLCGGITGINSAGTLGNITILNNTIGNTTNPNLRMGNLTTGANLSNVGTTFGIASGTGTFTGILNSATGTVTIGSVALPNTIQNASLNSSGTGSSFRGINISGGTYTITGNLIKNITSNCTNVTVATGLLAGVGILGQGGVAGSIITLNIINNLDLSNTTATGTNIAGISLSNTSVDVTRNKIYDLRNASTSVTAATPGTASGVFIRSGTAAVNTNIINNMISLGNGQTTNTSFIGIWGNHGSSPNPNDIIYFNSVHIEGTAASGANPSFGFHRGNFAVTPVNQVTVDIRNNIFDNTRTGGTGAHYAIGNFFNATTVSGVGWGTNASNFNVLNSANPATVGHWQTAQTFAGWQAASASDANSISGSTINFVNSATGDLHIVFPPVSVVESAGTDIPTVTIDFDGQTRSTLTPVDIGADAGNFTNAPSIVITPLNNTCVTGARTLTAVITDPDGVPTAGIGLPVLYWKINAGAYIGATATFVSGSTYNFSFGAGAVIGDVVSYYIAAQDNLSNVGTSPSFGASGFTANPPAASTPPTFPYSYLIAQTLSGTYTVGVGGNFTTLTNAANAYNIACLGGPVLFSLIDATYPGETFPITFNSNPDASAVNTLTIKPTGTTTISGSITSTLIQINGGDYITIDGSSGSTVNSICPAVSATRDLTIQNTNAVAFTAVVWFNTITTPSINGVTNCTIKNCIVIGGSNVNTAAGIGIGALPLISAGTDNDNNRIENNDIRLCRFGIYVVGQNAANKNEGNIINQNILTASSPNNIGEGGIFVANENNVTVSGNEVDNIIRTASPDSYGINLGFGITNGFSATTLGIVDAIGNATITFNKIGAVTNNSTFSAVGLAMSNTVSGIQLIANNTISGVFANGTAGDFSCGLWLNGGTGTVNVFHNTVVMQGIQGGTSTGSQTSTAFGVIASSSALTLRNNLFVNTQGGGIAGTTTRYSAISLGYASPYTGLISNKNDLFSSGAGPGTYTTGITGGVVAGTSRVTLADWQTETGQDLMSQSLSPVFTSPTNLHLAIGDPANAPLICGGAVTSVTTDIDCQTRSNLTPTIGADEVPNGIVAAIAISENSGFNNNDGIICSGTSVTLTASGGGTYAWSTGETTTSITVSPTMTTTYNVTVTLGSCSNATSVTITVVQTSLLSSVLTQPTTCVSADGAIDLTVTPAGTYTYDWADVAGTNNTEDRTGLIVGTYMVTVTNTATNCTNSLTVSLSGPGGCGVCPTIPNVSASPNPACSGVNFTLTSSGLLNMGNTYGIIFKSFPAATATPYTGGTVLATVPNASLTSGGTVATAVVSIASAGTVFIYAVLTPTPIDPMCTPSATTTLIVNLTPTAGTTVTETSGTTPNDGIICAGSSVTITGTGGGTYVWSTGATTTSITVSPASTMTYTVTVSSGNSGNSCTSVASRSITVNPVPAVFMVTGGGTFCTGTPGVAIGLSGSIVGVTYQLQVNAVNTGGPVAGTGVALNFGLFTAPGTYTVIASFPATACSVPMTGSAIVSSFNCSTQLFDPCTCLNNATTLTNGQFAESIKVNAPSTQTWTVTAVNGLYLMTSPPPPASPIPIPLGTVLTNLGAGMNMFILNGIHIDGIGYTVTVSNAAGTSLTIGNSCQYPNPAITSDINGTYCLYSDPITLTGDPGDANIVSQVFTVNGVPATQFNPGAGVGQYQIVYTVNGGVPKAFGPNDPGCTQSVSQFVNVITTPSTVACNDHVQISLGPDCEAEIVPSMILEGNVGCYDDYIVEMDVTLPYGDGPWVPPFLTSADIGKTYGVRVTHLGNGNSCWGTINVEDKIPPVIECRPVTILCGEALPSEPAPSVTGYQNILLTGLNDLLEVNSFTYNFDFSYLPTATPVLDVDVRIKIDDHTFLPDLNVELIAPSGYTKSIFTIGGCTGQEWPINCILDDDGATITLCVDLNAGDNGRLKPLQGGVSQPILFNFNGLDASGIWKVKISDIAAGDDGHVRAVGVFINVNLPPVAPTDNCGDVDLTYTDTQSGDPCEGLLITRHWIATDQSGNTSACDQLITVLPLVLDSVDCPAAYVGHCGESTAPSHTGWPSVNGVPITDDNNVCNIYVGFWDHALNDCGNGIKIVRTWTILDWCTQTTKECVQVIKLADDQAPIISCPSNLTVGTDFWYCYANVSVPKPTVTDACGSAWTLALTSTGGHIVNFGNNYVLNQLPLGTVTVTWTATDECGNHSSCSFTITVVDDVVPVALCDSHTVVALTNDGPFGITLVPAHVFDDGSYDACGPVTFRARRMDSCIDFDWTTDGACVDDIPGGIPPVNSRDKGTVSRPCVPFACCDVGAGSIMVELEVTDAAGNRNFCMVEAVVQDKISPFVQCPPDITVSCDFWFNVQEGTFVDADGNNNGNLDEDPLSPVFGNMYDAFQYNDDESVRQDIIINDPGNPHVSHPHFWGIDGWADDNCEVNLQVRVTITNDCSGETLPPGAPAGAVKLVTRRFSASDGNQGIAPGTCTQRIWVVDFDPFFITDITCGLYNNDDVVWPCDVLLTSCPDDLGDTGEPIVYDDACSLIGVAYEDQRFEFVDGACFKILRTWSVIDWCQYNSLTGEGLWHYVQVIKVHDNVGPEFLNCPTGPVTLCVADEGVTLPANNQAFLGHDNPLSSSCSVHLNLCQAVHETCSDVVNYDVKLYLFNGDEFIYVKPLTSIATDSSHNANLCFDTRTNSIKQIRDNGIPYNSPFCGDYHKLLWSAEDGCGNWSHCEYLIRLEDCKQPSPVCINGLSTVVMPIGGQVTIWAKDFNASSFDDCTAEEDLLYSFSGTSYTPSFTYTCDNVPAFGVELAVNIWVADGGTDDNCNGQISWSERNKDFCTTTIVINDNNHVCPDTSGSSIILAGEILTPEHQKVEKVAINLTCPGSVFPVYVTSSDGAYAFSNIIPQTNYTVLPERNDNYMNGVSTLDLVRIQKHLLGIDPFSSPYDYIAADANNSQSVSAIDIVELRKLILGIYTQLPANKSWRFVDKSFQFTTPTHPWPFSEEIDVANMISSQMDEDFVAIKVGDVNNSVKANAKQVLPRNENGVVSFFANDRTVTTGEMVDVAISSADFAAIEGYQFTLQTQGLEFRGIESGTINMSDDNMGVFGSTLTASWHKVGGVSATASDVLFTLKFQATAPGTLSSMMALNSKETQAEAYNTQDDTKGLKLTFRGAQHGAEFALYQNEPNPFKGTTVIGYDLPSAGKVTLTLFDVTGKVLLVRDQESVKGYNTISVSSKSIPSVGVLYYRLDANEYTATKKLVIIE